MDRRNFFKKIGFGALFAALPFFGKRSEATTLTLAEIPAHTHSISDPGHQHTLYGAEEHEMLTLLREFRRQKALGLI